MGRLGTEETDCECEPGEGIKTRRDGTNEEQMFSSKHSGCIWDPGFLSKREISTAPLDTHTHTQGSRLLKPHDRDHFKHIQKWANNVNLSQELKHPWVRAGSRFQK